MAAVQKVLLMGPHNGGKTSMRSVIFANYLARDTSKLGATVEVLRSQVKLLGSFMLNMWDCGGQMNYIRGYLDKQRQQTFSNVAALIYVCDAPVLSRAVEDRSQADALSDLKETMEALREHSPGAQIFVLVHKADLLRSRDDVLPTLINEINTHLFEGAQAADTPKYFATTIWDDSLFKAWSDILQCLVPHLSILQAYLRHSVAAMDIVEASVFDSVTFLTVCSVVREGHQREAARVTSALKGFKLSCTKSHRSFVDLVVVSDSTTVIFDRFTANTMIMLVTQNCSPEVARLYVAAIRNGLSAHLEAFGTEGAALAAVL
jgi:Ras-related GTP-binding protein A/B